MRILRLEPMPVRTASPIDKAPPRADWWRGGRLALLLIAFQLVAGCAIPSNLGTLKTPTGRMPDQFNADTRECMEWARKFRDVPLSQEEQALLRGIETARFFEGGRGRNGYSDHYVLCLIKRGYRWVPDAG